MPSVTGVIDRISILVLRLAFIYHTQCVRPYLCIFSKFFCGFVCVCVWLSPSVRFLTRFFVRNWCKRPAQLFSFEKNICLKKTKWNSTAMLLLKKCLLLFKIFQFSKNTRQRQIQSTTDTIIGLIPQYWKQNLRSADCRIAVPSHSQDFSATLCLCLRTLGMQNSKKTSFMDISITIVDLPMSI